MVTGRRACRTPLTNHGYLYLAARCTIFLTGYLNFMDSHLHTLIYHYASTASRRFESVVEAYARTYM